MPFSLLVAKVRHCVSPARFTSFSSLHVAYTPTEECDLEVLDAHYRWNYVTCKFEHTQIVNVGHIYFCEFAPTVIQLQHKHHVTEACKIIG